MDRHGHVLDYFLNSRDKDPDQIEIASWTKREGLVWLAAEQLPNLMEKLWLDPLSEPVLLTHVGNDERQLGNGFVLYLVFHLREDFTLTLGVTGIENSFPSLTAVCPALNWPEREVQDLFGLRAEGHPDPRSLVLHPGWPDGFHPLRKDSARDTLPSHSHLTAHGGNHTHQTFVPQPLKFYPAEGEGTFEIPVGPIHAGIIEPGHFRFQTIGETVLHLDAQLFYTHKGIERLLEGKSVEEGLKIVERICAVDTVTHALAYCEAVEKLLALDLGREALIWRTVLAEMERLYNHIGDIGNMGAGVGFALANANGLQCKEHLQRLNKELFGHRFLRGAVVLGGVKTVLTPEEITGLKSKLSKIAADFERWIPLILEHDGFRQRAINTGILDNQTALDLGVTGPGARASGVATDWRERHAYLLYPELRVEAQVESAGDCWSRLMIRVKEVRQSFVLIQAALAQAERIEQVATPKGALVGGQALEGGVANSYVTRNAHPNFLRTKPVRPKTHSFAWGGAESPRGMEVIWLMLDSEQKIYRCRVRTASYRNWPAVLLTVPGNIVPDFPLINKSFELCYSCCDR